MVMIAGDWTFHAEPDDLEDIFRPLSYLHVPVYGVLGNHDVEHPGPKIRNQLVPVLEEHGVIMLQNDVLDFGDRKLVGLGDYTGREDEVSLLRQFHVLDTVVVLTHNPDTTLAYDGYGADLTLVGHTHCGQIRLPFIHDYIAPFYIPVKGAFDCGVTQTKYTQIVITP